MSLNKKFDYDVALSFAGEDRSVAESLAEHLSEFGANIFYDRYYSAELWGKDLFVYLDEIYQQKAKFCIVFMSEHYLKKLWTNHERKSAQARSFSQDDEYILPIKIDDTEIPGIRLTYGYLDARTSTIEEIAKAVLTKLGYWDELESIMKTLNQHLSPSYEISIAGPAITFKSSDENFEIKYPIRLFLELHRIGMLVELFIDTAVLPH